MNRFRLIVKELQNYMFLRKVLRKAEAAKRDSLWKRYKLRRNWYGRVYTVVSLREEDMGEEAVVRNWKAMEMMRPINEYLSTIGLQEIIFPSIEEIPNSRSYLIVYSPIIEHLTFSWVIWRVFFIALITAALFFSYKFRLI